MTIWTRTECAQTSTGKQERKQQEVERRRGSRTGETERRKERQSSLFRLDLQGRVRPASGVLPDAPNDVR
ncbi:hypothetical protein Q8A67_019056 [Cirrhinus molitorella]|uniref:Uncharacterized protein n=1 Tax=Cirrhinus molitorella TaxID=172907 RepID=A0AA88P6G6_9TELE|nr:hypothetical protein Q8A67_019056 [Cirrhinus molitorella]